MKSILTWDRKMGFEARGDSGHTLKTDVAVEMGGTNSGARPMELVLYGLGGCTGADVVSILRKMRQDLTDLRIEITAERATEHPKRFTAIHLVYRFSGENLDPEKVRHAVELSQTKYCSVSGSLNAEMSYEVVVE